MTPARRIRVIWNASAGSKVGIPTNTATREQIDDVVTRHGLGDDVIATESEPEAVERTREAVAAGYEIVVAAGGDGTVGTVARQLIGTDVGLGILPLGSMMNIARSLDLPRDLDGAAAVIAAGETRSIDVGEAKEQIFFEAGSVGLSAALFREAQRVDEGNLRSAFTSVWIALRYRPGRMSIQLDDRTVRTRALMIAVANGPYTGMGLTLAPRARLDDGKFDVAIFSRFSRWELFRHLGSIVFGRRSYHPKVQMYRSARVHVESRHPHPCRADAHDLGTTPVTFLVRRSALKVVVPASADGVA